ncbi:hypothetical protein PSA7680_00296 [Pseudoruegeria aquimaris]|uniref:Uncharacterized protein n=1 Tax=Pseudoruegeria aquimaris TaxID=393663 RepID=A0A1Y5RCE7_9RHOB|nr:hypothetical protein [Pseudoruegeria aquimaris]SLN14153.1 hypothetical protein PSA7680_00296 [Pseudoruegeria aquimaris]
MTKCKHTAYTRPAKTNAASVGERGRSRWARHLRKKVFNSVPPMEFIIQEEAGVAAAVRRQRNSTSRFRRLEERPRWSTIQLRIEQVATVELLQARHLKATGKEISKAEAVAALMSEGLDRILAHADFGGTTAAADDAPMD